MKTAIWIIATVEVIRMIQNAMQIHFVKKSNDKQFKRATGEME